MDTGGFGGWGSESPDSTAAVIETLIALNIDPLANEWIKNGKNMVGCSACLPVGPGLVR